jgi:hypothetical protein
MQLNKSLISSFHLRAKKMKVDAEVMEWPHHSHRLSRLQGCKSKELA